VSGNADADADADADTADMDANSDAVRSYIGTRTHTTNMSAGSDAVCSCIRTRTDATDLGTSGRVLAVGGASRKHRRSKKRNEKRFHGGFLKISRRQRAPNFECP
jgi:hypothetical protein